MPRSSVTRFGLLLLVIALPPARLSMIRRSA